jgi:hypothetical protein
MFNMPLDGISLLEFSRPADLCPGVIKCSGLFSLLDLVLELQ